MTSKQFDPTKPYRRRDGEPAKIVYTFRKGHHFVVLDDTDGWVFVEADGRYSRSNGEDSDYDLVNIPEKIEGWLIIYNDMSVSSMYLDLNIAMNAITLEQKHSCVNQIACIKVSFTEGEGLE